MLSQVPSTIQQLGSDLLSDDPDIGQPAQYRPSGYQDENINDKENNQEYDPILQLEKIKKEKVCMHRYIRRHMSCIALFMTCLFYLTYHLSWIIYMFIILNIQGNVYLNTSVLFIKDKMIIRIVYSKII